MAKISYLARQELLANIKKKYAESGWLDKGKILDGFVAATGYQRKYAIRLLKQPLKKSISIKGRGKKVIYNQKVKQVITKLWQTSNYICAKRLTPFIPSLLDVMERHGHLHLESEVRDKLLRISTSTVERLLKSIKDKNPSSISTTTHGNFLKKQITVRTFADWDEAIAGFMEVDLVAHCGTMSSGSFLNTMVLTDIATCWTEPIALLHKASGEVIKGINAIKQLLPFSLLGLDSDNGSEFINYELLNYCKQHKITFTRSRSYKKNDQAHVEQKNGAIVRRLVGYDRLEGINAFYALHKFYAVVRLYINFFQPSVKLLSKTRLGGKVVKKYEEAKTPYQRIMLQENISSKSKSKLKEQFYSLDPVNLLSQIEKLQKQLWRYSWVKPEIQNELTIKNDDQDNNKESAKNIYHNENSSEATSIKQFYKRSKKPRKKLAPRTWRTRKDPFENSWKEIKLKLSLNPSLAATALLKELEEQYQGLYSKSNLRTLQRRIASWRRLQESHQKKLMIESLKEDKIIDQYLNLVMKEH